MSWFTNSHIDRGTGRNKRDKSPVREVRTASPERRNGRIIDRKASADKMKIERAIRRRSR